MFFRSKARNWSEDDLPSRGLILHRRKDLVDRCTFGDLDYKPNFLVRSSSDIVDLYGVGSHAASFNRVVIVLDIEYQFALAFDEDFTLNWIRTKAFRLGAHQEGKSTFFDRKERYFGFRFRASSKFEQVPDDSMLVRQIGPFVRRADEIHTTR